MTVNDMNSVIDNLASKLGVAVEYLNEVLLKQAQVEVIKSIITIILCSVAIAFCFFYFLKMFERNKNNCDYNAFDCIDDNLGLLVIAYCAALTSGIAIPCLIVGIIDEINQLITCVVNPQWYVIEQLMKLMK